MWMGCTISGFGKLGSIRLFQVSTSDINQNTWAGYMFKAERLFRCKEMSTMGLDYGVAEIYILSSVAMGTAAALT